MASTFSSSSLLPTTCTPTGTPWYRSGASTTIQAYHCVSKDTNPTLNQRIHTLLPDCGVQVPRWVVIINPRIERPVRLCHWNHRGTEVEDIVNTRVAKVHTLRGLVGSSRGCRRDNGIHGPAGASLARRRVPIAEITCLIIILVSLVRPEVIHGANW